MKFINFICSRCPVISTIYLRLSESEAAKISSNSKQLNLTEVYNQQVSFFDTEKRKLIFWPESGVKVNQFWAKSVLLLGWNNRPGDSSPKTAVKNISKNMGFDEKTKHVFSITSLPLPAAHLLPWQQLSFRLYSSNWTLLRKRGHLFEIRRHFLST